MKLNEFLKTMSDFVCMPSGAKESDIEIAQAELGTKFSEEYISYVQEFGSASADGHDLTGVVQSERLNVVNATERFREKNDGISQELYVIEEIGMDGIVVLQCQKGTVFLCNESSDPQKTADSILEYLKGLYAG